MTDAVLYEVQGKIAYITLNRPDARNAINGDVARGLEAAIDQLEADDEVWVGILTANTEGQERPVFCAGADLKAINSGQAGDLNTKRGGFAGFVYRERRKPIIVAVDGLATAGGRIEIAVQPVGADRADGLWLDRVPIAVIGHQRAGDARRIVADRVLDDSLVALVLLGGVPAVVEERQIGCIGQRAAYSQTGGT